MKTFSLLLSLVAGLAWPLEFMAPAYALPAGYFHLRGTVHDAGGGGALRSIDVLGKNGQASHYIGLNTTGYARDSQLWKERFPRNGTVDVIRLENKLTGQCLGGADHVDGIAVLAPCTDEITLWQKIAMSGNRAVFRRDFNGTPVCLGKDPNFAGLLLALNCSNGFTGEMTWEAYVSG
jgi:hypothetical protein